MSVDDGLLMDTLKTRLRTGKYTVGEKHQVTLLGTLSERDVQDINAIPGVKVVNWKPSGLISFEVTATPASTA